MDSRIPRIRSKLAKMPYLAQRSNSACEERHQFRLSPRISTAEADALHGEWAMRDVAGNRLCTGTGPDQQIFSRLPDQVRSPVPSVRAGVTLVSWWLWRPPRSDSR